MNAIKFISYILVIIGALNWGLVGFFNFDLVAYLFGAMTMLSKLIYSLVGVGAIILLFSSPTCFSKK